MLAFIFLSMIIFITTLTYVFFFLIASLFLFLISGGGLYGKIGIHDFEGVATDHGESERIIKDLTTKTKAGNLPDVLLMRQHGTTCCGPSVGAAFVKNFYMDRCCKLQMNLNQGGINAAPITDEVLAKMGEQFELDFIKHGCEWPAMVEYAEKYLGCGSF